MGKAGQNLNEFLTAIGLERPEIYISNVVKVRPSRVSAKGTVSNRPPNRQELAFFTPLLLEELDLVRPELVVTLGNTALQALLGKDAVIGGCHGRPRQAGPRTLFPLYHPASVIYNRSLQAIYQADLQALRKYLDA